MRSTFFSEVLESLNLTSMLKNCLRTHYHGVSCILKPYNFLNTQNLCATLTITFVTLLLCQTWTKQFYGELALRCVHATLDSLVSFWKHNWKSLKLFYIQCIFLSKNVIVGFEAQRRKPFVYMCFRGETSCEGAAWT